MTENRNTMQDKVNQGSFFFSQPTTFEKAYPMIDDITVKTIENGYGVYKWSNPSHFGKTSLGEYINCSNSSCRRGGFWIGKEIWEMVSKRETQRKTIIGCRGDEGSHKGKRMGRSCINHIETEITIKYKEVPKATDVQEIAKSPAD